MRQPGERRPVVAEDLTRLRWPMEPSITSEGEHVAFVVSGPSADLDRLTYELYVYYVRTGRTTRVGFDTTCRRPRFSPDGDRLAYIADSADGRQLAIAHAGSERIRSVGGASVIDYDWSPSGDRVVIACDLSESPLTATEHRSALSIVTLEGVEADVDIDFDAPVSTIRWSPDGTRIALVATSQGAQALWIYDLQSSSLQSVHTWHGPMKCCEWSPDASVIAILGHPHGPAGWHNDEIWLVRPNEPGEPTRMTPGFDQSVGLVVRGDDQRGIADATLSWSADNASVFALVAFGGRSGLVQFGIDGSHQEVVAGDRSLLGFAIATSTGAPVFSWSDHANPGELTIATGGAESAIAHLNDDWLAEVQLARITPVRAGAGAGYTVVVDGWLSEPIEPIDLTAADNGARQTPLVVQVHGGPHYPVGSRFSFDAHRLAGLGMCLLRCNPRGSQGYGEPFASATTGDWGGGALRDIVALTDAAGRRPQVDADRVAIMGESYGGYMVNWALSTTDRFVAGVSENSISDVLSLARGPRGPSFWHLEFDADPAKEPQRFTAGSPIETVESITAPLLLVHAEDDDNCPIEQSEAIYDALRSLGRPVEMVRIPGEGHFINVFGRPSRRTTRTLAIDAFLERHLIADQPSTEDSSL